MILIKLQGGLGNQMFQYAFGSIMAKQNKTKIVIEDSAYRITDKRKGFTPRNFELSIFENHYEFVKESDISLFNNLSLLNRIKRKLKLNFPKKKEEETFEYSSELLALKAPVFFTGYFQSYKYFAGFEEYVKTLFSFSIDKLSQENKNLIHIFKQQNTIAVHIRRGDYVTDTITNQFHGLCDIQYYEQAILLIASKIQKPTLVFFSDDPEWVKQNFENLNFPKIYINHNKEENSWQDMFLMSICSHNIIANSSFSWWAAWLNDNKNKIVIAPKKWFKAKEIDIKSMIPEEWIII
ncbi:hypothetical protein HNP37_003733 [Flavobacterium nitrogenifigens]|uniref:Glycosyl transferase family 11 n=2 Tax=Flavobacterium TaxID=237 RepID=A0A7W7N8B1_9FLAO|nr:MULTISPECIES: alpha-1,2-fucosyltransferase [Flavobacterium]MBB4803658.1 hypothetical protein [Flavobacterium nitrogenifigens]MBB6388537.1 hypothetical protein [Flavobacterium notoginsengisoli]